MHRLSDPRVLLHRSSRERIPQHDDHDNHQHEDYPQEDTLDDQDEEQAAMVPISLEDDVIQDHPRIRSVHNPTANEETVSLQPEAVSSTSPSDSQSTPAEQDELSESEENVEMNDLNQLLVQREYHQRATRICTFILALVIFRLWIEALMTLNLVLIIFSSFMTSYLFAWRVHRAAVNYELNEQIDALQNNDTREPESQPNEEGTISGWRRSRRSRRWNPRNRNRGIHGNNRGGGVYDFDDWDFGANRDHIDLEMLGFQAQLAIAIMESQRHILETGGYGRPDGGEDPNQMRGVSDDTKAKWKAFEYNPKDPKVKECADLKPHKNDEPSCCICLCEYEEGEMLNQLACGHVYHRECIHSWCENHTRCPLCNLDLEDSSYAKDGNTAAAAADIV